MKRPSNITTEFARTPNGDVRCRLEWGKSGVVFGHGPSMDEALAAALQELEAIRAENGTIKGG